MYFDEYVTPFKKKYIKNADHPILVLTVQLFEHVHVQKNLKALVGLQINFLYWVTKI